MLHKVMGHGNMPKFKLRHVVTREPNENNDDALHQLEKLGSLRQQGLITEEEFQRMKSKLISSI